MSNIETRNYFAKGEHVADVAKHLKDADFVNVPGKPGSEEYRTNVAKARREATLGFIESKIQGGNGSIVRRRKEGNVHIWTVKWPDGETQEVRYAIN
jgi:hypothetical protein